MKKAVPVSVLLLLFLTPLPAQIVTGSVVGRIEDPGGGAVPGAAVTLIRVATGLERQTATNVAGEFVFAGVEGGEYRVVVQKAGFKKAERKDLMLPSGVRLPLGVIVLEIGQLSDSVTVTAESSAIVQTQSAERADLITSAQVENLQIIGRNVPSLVSLLPGVVVTEDPAGLDRRTIFNALGTRNTANQVSVDGLPSTDLGNGNVLKLQQSMDSVAEVRILVSNYQAEYGSAAGASVEMVLKSGTRNFHGLGSYFKRHEEFNANSFFNNRLGVPKSRYRYNTWTYNIGGPVYIPGKFNRDKDKMFFFWSQEFWPRTDAATYKVTTPTELERAGDFSQTLDVSGKLIAIKDPYNNGQPFPGNRIPAARIDRNGQALMKVFPLPNFFDRGLSGGQYNYVFSSETGSPKKTYTLKLDYNFNPKNLLFLTFGAYSEKGDGYINVQGWTESWEQIRRTFLAGNKGFGARYTRIFTPAISNEFHWGWFMNPESLTSPASEIKRNQRDTVGFTAGQFYPKVNRFNFIPNATYGGVPGAASLNINGRFPIDDPYNSFTWTDKLSIIHGAHTAKAGVLVEWYGLGRASNADEFGSFNFARNTNNPLDTNWAYSNAILGVFNTYTESSALPYMNARSSRVEWFVQDNWRVSRRLTLDFGLRMSRFVPIHDRDNGASAFLAGSFDPARQVRLIAPGRDAQGKRAGVHPVTGEIYPATLIGGIAPGVGDPANGMAVAGTGALPATLLEQRGWHFGPRAGFALDPFGKGRTSIRGGFGMSYTQAPMNQWQPLSAQEPLVRNPTVYYGAISTLLSSSGFLFPTAVTSVDPAGHLPTVMNYSFSIQQNVGFDTVVDVAYVGSLGRHLLWSRNLNAIPYGANFKPENIDPTTKLPYAAAFLRPITGFNNISLLEHAGTSNYHSLQISANRRFARNLQFGFAWSWSKAMDYVDGDGGGVASFVPIRVWNYGLAGFDRTHTVKINWLYDLPRVPWDNLLARSVLGGWQLSGIATFQSGAPAGVGYNTTTGADITGSPTEGSRIVVTGNPVLPKSERSFDRFFRTDVFQVPAVGTWGNAAKTLFRGPGINNWDVSVFKNFAVREGMKFQLRCEAYNAFNHTQFSGVNATARFDAAGAQVNPTFGQLTAARSPRLMQLALRFMF